MTEWILPKLRLPTADKMFLIGLGWGEWGLRADGCCHKSNSCLSNRPDALRGAHHHGHGRVCWGGVSLCLAGRHAKRSTRCAQILHLNNQPVPLRRRNKRKRTYPSHRCFVGICWKGKRLSLRLLMCHIAGCFGPGQDIISQQWGPVKALWRRIFEQFSGCFEWGCAWVRCSSGNYSVVSIPRKRFAPLSGRSRVVQDFE